MLDSHLQKTGGHGHAPPFTPAHPSCLQVKQSGEDSGTGGDWAVRLSAERVPGRGAPRKRISLVMYLGDEGVARPPGWSVMPEGEVGRWDGAVKRTRRGVTYGS